MRLLGCVALAALSFGLSLGASGHATVLLARNAWTPLILAVVLLLGLGSRRAWVPLLAAGTIASLLLAMVPQWWAMPPTSWDDAWQLTRLRPSGYLPHPNDVALVALLTPFAPLLMWPLAAAAVLLSWSRLALVGWIVAAGLAIPSRWRWPMWGACLIGALVFLPGHAGQTAGHSRIGHWLVAVRMAREAPWLGKGPASFVDYDQPYQATAGLPDQDQEIAYVPWAHNLYLEQLGERGLMGLVAFAVPLAVAFRRGSRPVRAAIVALLVMGLVDLTFLKPWVVGAYWGLVWCGVTDAPA